MASPYMIVFCDDVTLSANRIPKLEERELGFLIPLNLSFNSRIQRGVFIVISEYLPSPNICHLRIFSISFFYDMSFYMKIGYLRCTMIPVKHPWLNG
uniref:Uncharacterized protein n=1 Tax=Setaria viridis TaxID=4556 RepID=A0A4U6VMB2_SETVI|nr:hypothetical protein SEVIR_3G352500v2 [Setaria viridis]